MKFRHLPLLVLAATLNASCGAPPADGPDDDPYHIDDFGTEVLEDPEETNRVEKAKRVLSKVCPSPEVTDLLDKLDSGVITIVDLKDDTAYGTHDNNTIALNMDWLSDGKLPSTLLHEGKHACSAISGGKRTDPETNAVAPAGDIDDDSSQSEMNDALKESLDNTLNHAERQCDTVGKICETAEASGEPTGGPDGETVPPVSCGDVESTEATQKALGTEATDMIEGMKELGILSESEATAAAARAECERPHDCSCEE